MSLLGRTAFKNVAAKRFFSAAAASPKTAIAQNIMLLHEISQATDEATLAKISARGLPNVDLNNTPEELKDLSSYFSLSDISSGNEKFQPDPTAWQNMSPLAYAGHELQRAETWPFFVGLVSVLLLLGVGIGASLPKEGDVRKNSKYLQMLEGRAHSHEAHH